jgi:hypothetical protein
MRRFLTGPAAILTVVCLIAGCTSSDDTADETTTAAPATTVAPPETATTVAATTSTTLSETAAIATVEALQEALNAYDSDAVLALFADGGVWVGTTRGSPRWEERFAEMEAWGHHGTLSDCVATDGVLRCLQTWESTNHSGKAGVVWLSEWEVHFDDQGLIRNVDFWYESGKDEQFAFGDALGAWMATAYPEAYETFFLYEGYWNKENWSNRADELSPLIDEFIAQSDEYPLSR